MASNPDCCRRPPCLHYLCANTLEVNNPQQDSKNRLLLNLTASNVLQRISALDTLGFKSKQIRGKCLLRAINFSCEEWKEAVSVRRTAMKTVEEQLAALAEKAQHCRKCPLYRGRSHAVYGEGPAAAQAMFIGEAPGKGEDESGRPFIGRTGRFFERMLEDCGRRKGIYGKVRAGLQSDALSPFNPPR